MTTGNRIAKLRKDKGFTQEYIAEQLGVSRQAVSKWEQDLTSPDTKNLIAISSLLDASVEYIATGSSMSSAGLDKEHIQKLAFDEVEKQDQKRKNKIRKNLTVLMVIFLILSIVICLFGILFGEFHDFRDINGLSIIFMPYGFGTIAIVLEVVNYLFLAAFLVLVFFRIKMDVFDDKMK